MFYGFSSAAASPDVGVSAEVAVKTRVRPVVHVYLLRNRFMAIAGEEMDRRRFIKRFLMYRAIDVCKHTAIDELSCAD